MLPEVLEALKPAAGEVFIDGTFGAGGYTRAILESAPEARVLAFDRDRTAIAAARALGGLSSQFIDRLILIEAPFSEMEEAGREELGVASGPFADGVVLDIGVSSMQIDDPKRGFSFMADGPLDMRMSAGHGMSAADFLARAEDNEIADVLYQLGEEKRSRQIARAIVRQRETAPLATTLELARLVAKVLGPRGEDGKHPATRTFQALRIHVNDELGELKRALSAAERCLKPSGRLVVVTFHSLEDRIVKQFLIQRTGRAPLGSRHLPPSVSAERAPSFRIVNPRALTPCQGELAANPRSRSAKLRAAIRTEAPAFPSD